MSRFLKTRSLGSVSVGLIAIVIAAMSGPFSVSAQRPTTAAAGPVTFTKDVAPILQASCTKCHRPDSIAPMSLMTYEDARPWARSMKAKVSQREMPPWFIERNVGIQKFKDDQSLSEEQIATIVKWVDGGAVQGNPADMPPAPKY